MRLPGGTGTLEFYGDIYSTVSSAWLGVNYDAAKFLATKGRHHDARFSDQNNAVMITPSAM